MENQELINQIYNHAVVVVPDVASAAIDVKQHIALVDDSFMVVGTMQRKPFVYTYFQDMFKQPVWQVFSFVSEWEEPTSSFEAIISETTQNCDVHHPLSFDITMKSFDPSAGAAMQHIFNNHGKVRVLV